MKPFRLNPHQARQSKKDIDAKDKIVAESTRKMNAVLKTGVDQVYAHYLKTGKYKDPKLPALEKVFDEFYRRTLTEAINSCKNQNPKKKLAAVPDGKLPAGEKPLEEALKRNKGFFQSVMKRASALKQKALKAYLDKLRKQFQKVLPLLETTELSPKEAKQKIAEAWDSSKARTETIFRTESTKYFAKAQVAYFADSDEIIGFLFDSVRDTSRTSICQSRHGLIYRPGTKLLAQNTPPCHYNCRSHFIPLVNDEENRKMLEDPRRDPSKVQVEPLPPNWKAA